MSFELRELRNEEEVKDIYNLEIEYVPAEEAVDYETYMYYHQVAPELTLGCFHDGTVIGFVSATRYSGQHFTEESEYIHEPNGETVCIHAVAVRHSHRRKGVALRLLDEFIKKCIKEQDGIVRIVLITKSNLIPLYNKAGFSMKGPSDVHLGADQWYEMVRRVTPDIG